jgi:hypothetical protein
MRPAENASRNGAVMFEFDKRPRPGGGSRDAVALTLGLAVLVAAELWLFNRIGSSLRHLYSLAALAFVPLALTVVTLVVRPPTGRLFAHAVAALAVLGGGFLALGSAEYFLLSMLDGRFALAVLLGLALVAVGVTLDVVVRRAAGSVRADATRRVIAWAAAAVYIFGTMRVVFDPARELAEMRRVRLEPFEIVQEAQTMLTGVASCARSYRHQHPEVGYPHALAALGPTGSGCVAGDVASGRTAHWQLRYRAFIDSTGRATAFTAVAADVAGRPSGGVSSIFLVDSTGIVFQSPSWTGEYGSFDLYTPGSAGDSSISRECDRERCFPLPRIPGASASLVIPTTVTSGEYYPVRVRVRRDSVVRPGDPVAFMFECYPRYAIGAEPVPDSVTSCIAKGERTLDTVVVRVVGDDGVGTLLRGTVRVRRGITTAASER